CNSFSDIEMPRRCNLSHGNRYVYRAAHQSTPMGRFFFHVMGALAEMEHELIVERTLAGLAAARAQGRIGGRRPKLTKEQHEQIARLIKNGHDRKQLAIIYDIGISTIYRYHPVGDIQAEETTRQTQENENR
ncbi:helix-turn-helix domain-containing protein, partial [Escherichia coli]